MISGITNEKVSYRTRYLNFPSTLTESVPSISRQTVHIIKVRFNNIFSNKKALFATIVVSLMLLSVLLALSLHALYNSVAEVSETGAVSEIEQVQTISAEDSGVTVMNKSSFFTGASGSSEGGGSYTSNGGGADSGSILIANNDEKVSGKEILVSRKAVIDIVTKSVADPFMPITERQGLSKKSGSTNLVLPPTSVTTDSTASVLLSTVISGIMYDANSPSAIVKVSGTDYLVKKGDVVNGLKVLNISPKTVTLKLGKNVYEAPVGMILATLPVTNNTSTVNLNKRFGGNN